jgi:hypothetical protein
MTEREKVDKAIFEYIQSLGVDAISFDYSEFNELLDEIN